MDDSQLFRTFLTGVFRINFEKEEGITMNDLKEQLQLPFAQDEFDGWVTKCNKLIEKLSYYDMDLSSLQEFLSTTDYSDGQMQAIGRFWRGHRAKAHEVASKNSMWDNTLSKFSWRVDIQTSTSKIPEISQPCAIVELVLESPSGDEGQVVRFEMDRNETASALFKLKQLQGMLQKIVEEN